MATLKQRVHRYNGSSYDTVHYETQADLVTYTNNSQSTVSGALDDLYSKFPSSTETIPYTLVAEDTLSFSYSTGITGTSTYLTFNNCSNIINQHRIADFIIDSTFNYTATVKGNISYVAISLNSEAFANNSPYVIKQCMFQQDISVPYTISGRYIQPLTWYNSSGSNTAQSSTPPSYVINTIYTMNFNTTLIPQGLYLVYTNSTNAPWSINGNCNVKLYQR